MTESMIKDLMRFESIMGYPCNLDDPKSHNEKVMAKKYTDRNPLLTLTADKIRVKEWVDEVIPGNKLFEHRYFASTDPSEIVDKIKENTVLKMNNASGRNMFFYDNPHRDEGGNSIADIERVLAGWFKMPYGLDKGEWCYEDIEPGALLERIIFKKAHNNYRFLCFNGEPLYVHVHNYELYPSGHHKPVVNFCSTYDMEWRLQPVQYKSYVYTDCPRPKQLDEMIEISRMLSAPFDYVRIDFMVSKGHVYFGEMTHYPVSGKCRFNPVSFDYMLGGLW